jgi:hypothetical protein
MGVQATTHGRVPRRALLLAAATLAALGVFLSGCGGHGPAPAAVPSLSQGAGTHTAGSSRATQLHAAAECIRQHGIPGYADPVLTPSGAVYSDLRSLQNASASAQASARAACGTLVTQAGFNPVNEPPAPPQLVQAGVLAAQCERLHGLPNVHDPSANTPYTPGHGFGLTDSEVPAGGKQSHGFQQALRACHTQISAEIRASTMASLGSDG